MVQFHMLGGSHEIDDGQPKVRILHSAVVNTIVVVARMVRRWIANPNYVGSNPIGNSKINGAVIQW